MPKRKADPASDYEEVGIFSVGVEFMYRSLRTPL
jgi:hypothetical protein